MFSLSASSNGEVNTGVGGEGGLAPRKLTASPFGRRVAGVNSMTGVRVARALSSADGAVNSASYIPERGGGTTCSRLRTVFARRVRPENSNVGVLPSGIPSV